MRLVVNARTVIPGKFDGIGWYTYEIGRRLVEVLPEAEHHWVFDRPYASDVVPSGVIPHVVWPPARHPVLWHLWHQYNVPRMLSKVSADVYWSSDGFIPLSSRVPSIATLHDVAFELDRSHTTPLVGAYYRWMLPKCARKTTRLTTVSGDAQRTIAALYSIPTASIAIIPNGVRSTFQHSNRRGGTAALHTLNEGRPYILHVGTVQPRKNIARLIQGFDAFVSATGAEVDLVCVGASGWALDDVREAYSKAKHHERIRFVGYVHDDQLANWYAGAMILAFVPLYEGFGVPIIEAFSSGIPVVTSDRAPMTDIAGDAAVYANPESVPSIAAALQRLWMNEDDRNRCIERGEKRAQGFSWDASARMLANIIEEIALCR